MPAREQAVSGLLDTLYQTLRYFDQPVNLEKSYAPGKWTAREILVHLSDCETVLLERLRRLACEEKPLLVAFDENRWAATLSYKTRDLGLARLQYEAARRNVLEVARMLDASFDAKVGTHSEAGTRTFAQVISHLAEHNAHHLEQLKAIAEGRTWTKK
jgi:hypothetical protein